MKKDFICHTSLSPRHHQVHTLYYYYLLV